MTPSHRRNAVSQICTLLLYALSASELFATVADTQPPGRGVDGALASQEYRAGTHLHLEDLASREATYKLGGEVGHTDFCSDGIINFVDLAIFAGRWMDSCPGPDSCGGCDLDANERVDLKDLDEFGKQWLSSPQNSSRPRKGPYAEFVVSVEQVIDTLKGMEQELRCQNSIWQQYDQLVSLNDRIRELSSVILENFDEVKLHCEQALLPTEIMSRRDVALQSYIQTEQAVVEAIEAALFVGQTGSGAAQLAGVQQALADLESLNLRNTPGLHNSKPTIWEIQSPEALPVEPFDASAPSVDVMAAAAAEPPTLQHLIGTLDAQITDEIVDKANELGYSASAIYEFVRNECKFQAYFGSRKGSVETLRQRSGNDYDLASLTIALLRASGISARYATGIVEMPVDRAKSWLGVEDGSVAGSILTTMGLEGVAMWSGGEVVAIRCRRVWVEAYVSRGRAGRAWVPLDPAFKLHSIHAGMDIPDEMGLDAQAFIDEYYEPADPCVVLPRQETPLELLKQQISDYLAANHPSETVESVMRRQEIVPEDLGLLPASLPYKVLSRGSSFSEIPAEKVYQVRFHLHDGGTTLIDETFDLPEIAGERITISYIGATPADQATIDSYNGLLYTPPYLVDIKPVLKIAGQEVATSSVGIGAGVTHSSDIHFLAPTNDDGLPQNMVPAIYNDIIAGEYQAIGLAVQGATSALLLPADPCDTEDFLAQLRYATATGYLQRCISADDDIGALLHTKVTRNVDDAILQDQISVSLDAWGDPLDWEWCGLTVDADRKIIGSWKVDEYESGCGGESKEVMVLGGAEGSLYESLIFESDFSHEAVSTIKILELAVDQGITVYKRWDSLPLPSNDLPGYVRTAIENAILAGREVTFPASQITHGNWTGCGYVDMNPCTGAAGYIIAGGQNGGSTVDEWTDIIPKDPDKTVDYVEGDVEVPPADFPTHLDALFHKSDNNPLHFEYKLRIRYTDGSYGPWGDYSHDSLSPSALSAGHYTLTVGDQGPDHIRKLTIFDFTGVLTPDDDFSGRSQSKYGIEETVDLTSEIMPTGLTAGQVGGLEWTKHSGVGSVSNAGNDGEADYDAEESAGSVTLRLTVKSGPSAGCYKSYSKTVILPSGTRMTRTTGNVWHIQWTASAGIQLHYWLDPKKVSFNNLEFGEGGCPATPAWGVCSTIGGHAQNYFGAILGGNSTTGCRVASPDHAWCQVTPWNAGDGGWTWRIPTQYIDGTGTRHSFGGTQNHVSRVWANGNATQSKGGQSGSAAASDPTSGW